MRLRSKHFGANRNRPIPAIAPVTTYYLTTRIATKRILSRSSNLILQPSLSRGWCCVGLSYSPVRLRLTLQYPVPGTICLIDISLPKTLGSRSGLCKTQQPQMVYAGETAASTEGIRRAEFCASASLHGFEAIEFPHAVSEGLGMQERTLALCESLCLGSIPGSTPDSESNCKIDTVL
jgi:hypothetical protein